MIPGRLMAVLLAAGLCLSSSMTLKAAEDWGRDPFDTTAGSEVLLNDTKPGGFWLTGILYREGRQVAIINRVLLRPGDEIQGALVWSIQSDHVVLVQDGREIVLRMGGMS